MVTENILLFPMVAVEMSVTAGHQEKVFSERIFLVT